MKETCSPLEEGHWYSHGRDCGRTEGRAVNVHLCRNAPEIRWRPQDSVGSGPILLPPPSWWETFKAACKMNHRNETSTCIVQILTQQTAQSMASAARLCEGTAGVCERGLTMVTEHRATALVTTQNMQANTTVTGLQTRKSAGPSYPDQEDEVGKCEDSRTSWQLLYPSNVRGTAKMPCLLFLSASQMSSQLLRQWRNPTIYGLVFVTSEVMFR